MKNPKGCWWICAGVTLALFCTIGMNVNAFSVYAPYLTEKCNLTYTQSSNFVVIRTMFAFISMLFVTKFYEKLEIRWGYAIALVLAALTQLLYAEAVNFAGLCLAAACSGLAYGLGGVYPASVLIHRWFKIHSGLAMGICTASTGLAATVFAPLLTMLIEKTSMETALYAELAMLLGCTAVCVLLIRNWPRGEEGEHRAKHIGRHHFRLSWMFVASVAIGIIGNPGYQSFSMHYSNQGFDAYQISVIVAVAGVTLAASKFLLGELADLWGAYRANWLFYGLAIVGSALCCVGIRGGFALAVLAVGLYGLGESFTTVGLSIYAADLSAPEDYADVLQQYQMAFMLGGFLAGPLPGVFADWTGSYIPFYALVTALCVFALVVVQVQYKTKKKLQK